MRVLHDGPLHYTSVDGSATRLSYLAVTLCAILVGRAGDSQPIFVFTFCVLKHGIGVLGGRYTFTFSFTVVWLLIYGSH